MNLDNHLSIISIFKEFSCQLCCGTKQQATIAIIIINNGLNVQIT